MNNTFFTTGGTLATDSPSYVERQADRELYGALSRGEYCYILTCRQMGKSSLMVRTALRLRKEGTRVVLLDLTSLGQNITPEQWYEGLAEGLGSQLDLEDEVYHYWRDRSHLPPLRRWMSLLKDVVLAAPSDHSPTAPVVIFIDEIDAILSLPFSTDEFFAGIRECYNRRSSDPLFQSLTFCLLGVATPSDLIRDVRTTPFNIGRRIELTDFSADEAQPLARGLSSESSASKADPQRPAIKGGQANRILARVLYWTGGHPFLTQRLCRAVTEAPSRSVDALCSDLFLSARGSQADDNLLFVRDRLLRTGLDLAGILELLGRIRDGTRVPADEANPLLDALRLSGIIHFGAAGRKERSCGIRNRIYARVFDRGWIQRHMPDAELRRQRAAFRKGVLRASSLAGAVVAVMLGLTLTAAHEAGIAHAAQRTTRVLNGSLRTSLSQQVELNHRLETALGEARTARSRASRSADAALAASRSEAEQRQKAEASRSVALAAGRVADRARQEAVNRLSRASIDASTRAAGTGDLLAALPPLADALKLDQGNADREPIHRIRLACLLRESPRLRDMWNAGAGVRSLAVSPNGALAAAGCDAGTVRLFDLRGKRPARDLIRRAGNLVSIAFSPDSSRIATADQAGIGRVWEVRTGKPLTPPLPGLGRLQFITWHPSGRRIVFGGDNGAVAWDLQPVHRVFEMSLPKALGCRPVYSPRGDRIALVCGNFRGWMCDGETGGLLYPLAVCFNGTDLEFSPNGASILLSGSFGQPVQHLGAAILDASTGKPLHYLEMPALGLTAALSRDGQRAVVGDRKGNVAVWDVQTGSRISAPIQMPQEIAAVSLRPDGRQIAAASRDGLLSVRDAVTGAACCAPMRHGSFVAAVAYSHDGRLVLSASEDGAGRIWSLPPEAAPAFPGGSRSDEKVLQVDHLEGDRWSVGRFRPRAAPKPVGDESVRVWGSRSGRPQVPGNWRSYAVSADRRWLALAGDAGVQLWDAAAGKASSPLYPVTLTGAELSLQPEGRWLAVLERSPSGASALRVVNLRTGRVTRVPSGPVAQVYGFFHSGRVLWFRTVAGEVMLWPLDGNGSAKPAQPKHMPVWDKDPFLTANPDGSAVVTVCGNLAFRAWDGQGRPLCRELRYTGGYPWVPQHGVSFSPDGRRVVLFGTIHSLRDDRGVGTMVDLKNGTERRLWDEEGFPHYHTAVFSPAGDRFATFSDGGAIQVWDTLTLRPTTKVLRHSTLIHSVAFSADGRRLVSCAVDGTARVWDVVTGRAVTPFLTHPADVLTASFSPDGRLLLTCAADKTVRLWDGRTGEAVMRSLDFGAPVDDSRFLPDSRHVLAHCGPQARICDLLPDLRPLPALTRECLLLAAHTADGNGGLQALEPEQLRALWERDHPASR